MHYVNETGNIAIKIGNKITYGHTQKGKHVSRINAVELLTVLKAMRVYFSQKDTPTTGICGQVTTQYRKHAFLLFDSPVAVIGSLSMDWEHYSGNPQYPIKTGKKSAWEQYNKTDLFWSKRSAYGRARHSLLEYLIAKIEAMIESSEQDCLAEEIQTILNKPKNKKFVVNVESFIDLNSISPRETKTKVSVRKRRGHY